MENIAVIYGGISNERDVSLRSGKGVIKALQNKGYQVIPMEYQCHKTLLKELLDKKPDFVYIALHGRYGEDGRIQSLLELLDIPYVGSGVLASALAMNKSLAKKHFEFAGIRVAKEKVYRKRDFSEDRLVEIVNEIESTFNYPVVIKPNEEGSTIGLTIANNRNSLLEGLQLAVTCASDILLEEYIKGVEITVAVLGSDQYIEALPVIEIVPKNDYYDYESKYAPGGSEHIIPARIDESATDTAKKWAVAAHKALGCETYSRVDFIIPETGDPVILEVNTLPGMTETSLFPDAARSVGLPYEDMLEKIVQIAQKKYNK
ncbi:D-alanine--D-alanine ligase [Desulfuribacillus stibiiarsenatis]|uniref:D-alanine--D-alanine ligase n=1 Tax=Desulfuribacillus stibiiarsenatis TaxID=1390249 RepID=A0A1E5L400_9FIRM|nr:D-alanine--D-alanine ligase [Desulfuribacillus stibiiarsenatis]OEH84743.1 D-alanine--D-alanine ligase [Desulfuribacillus stibiiarsenatis]